MARFQQHASSSSHPPSLQKKAVKTVYCNDTSLPSHLSTNSARHRKTSPSLITPNEESLSKKEELRSYLSDIKDFNANMEIGKTKRKIYQDKLSRLGAPPVKPQKMPLKLKIELNNARKKREKQELENFRASKVINAQFSNVVKKFKTNKRNKSKN